MIPRESLPIRSFSRRGLVPDGGWLRDLPPKHSREESTASTVRMKVNLLFNVTIYDISVIHVTAHRCAGGLKKKLNLRSGSQRHRHFAGSLTCPSKHRHGTTLFIRWFRHTAPFSRLLRSRWGYGGHILDLTPRALMGELYVWTGTCDVTSRNKAKKEVPIVHRVSVSYKHSISETSGVYSAIKFGHCN